MMIRNIRLARLAALLAILLALAGCQSAETARQAAKIDNLLAARGLGVNSNDQQQYIDTVLPSDTVLLKEETNLIRSAGGLGIQDYKTEADTVEATGDGNFTAQVTQSYTLDGEKHQCAYTALFIPDGDKLYYGGPAFNIKQNDRVKVYFTGDRDALARQLLNAETAVLANMKEQLGFVPKGFISVKLYDDQSVFLQSVKLDLPAWVGGWHEYGESIKSFVGAYSAESMDFTFMLNHESTHRMVSELSNDNASYWLQEGLAGIYQTALGGPPGEEVFSSEEAAVDYTPFAEQKKIDLENLGVDNQGSVSMYYASSKAYAAFLLETWGWDKVRQALEYMKKFELIPVTGAEKMEDTNARTDEALQNVLGYESDGAFQVLFDTWLENKR